MENNIQQELKSIRIVYSALIIATASFLIASVALKFLGLEGSMASDMMTYQTFQFASFAIGIASFGAGIYIFNKKAKEITATSIHEKITQYRAIMIIRGAFFEGASFFFVIGYFLFHTDFFIIATLIGLGFLAFFFPTTARIAKELNVQEKELQ